ncbi:coiled-coil domain-containing protein 22 homolog [Toxorhynchites rutilus septentrionalis]|uniref:coiled-coil domain-containing protein 22 homolog n=1 Tax=Toxorhynchites rutilus septentrionalis TaxID=329112 RepID=UPI002479F620|nr:coiled-coil domain-containing protein 22 homolog [Toxorhynchites rutilus septentrionalis]
MDEIDNIILHSLRQIGCNLDEDVRNLDEFGPTLLVQIVSKCIALIDPSLNLPKTLPPGMAQRFTVTASLAEACRTIGYRRDIGYQTFLYSNVAEMRRLLMFLIERLPKEAVNKSGAPGEPLNETTELENRIVANLQSELQAPWMPEFCRMRALSGLNSTEHDTASSSNTMDAKIAFRRFVPKKLSIPFVTHKDVAAEIRDFWSHQSLDEDSFVPSIIAANDGAIKSNNPESVDEIDCQLRLSSSVDKLQSFYSTKGTNHPDSPSEHPVESSKTIERTSVTDLIADLKPGKTPLETLQGETDQIRADIERNAHEFNALKSERASVSEIMETCRKAVGKLKEQKKMKERTHILLENTEVNVKKLEGIIAAAGDRMRKLQDQWETHRNPLVETLESYNSDKLSKSQLTLNQIESTRQKCEQLINDLQTKSAMHARLQKEFEKLNKTISRTAYTSRILEIIGNIRKQKNGIDKILQDTRTLQKEINTITGQLDRQFTVTDDLIFRNAKKDEHSKRAYKLLVTLHSDCTELIGLVQETGSIKREIRDLEDQIENEKTRNTAANLTQITNDVSEMQNESHRLEESIRRMEQARQQ